MGCRFSRSRAWWTKKNLQVSSSMLGELAGDGPEEFWGHTGLASNLLGMPFFRSVNSNLPCFFHGEFQSMVNSLVWLEVLRILIWPCAHKLLVSLY